MVSLPAIKQLSLRVSQLLKGAAIAERLTIAGVACFILSREPSPGKFVHGMFNCHRMTTLTSFTQNICFSPKHTFLVALDEVVDACCLLVSGAASNLLGIDVDHVIVTGILAGGNLAVSLCVKLQYECIYGKENMVDVDALIESKQHRDSECASFLII